MQCFTHDRHIVRRLNTVRTYGHISSIISRTDRLPTGPDALLAVLCLLSAPYITNDYLMTGLNPTLFGVYIYIEVFGRSKNNLVPRVSHLPAQAGGKMRDPGNEVGARIT